MRPPNLTRALVLEAPQRSDDGAGGFTTTWTPLGTLWAEVSAGSGRAEDQAGLALAEVAYRITVRAAPPGAPSRPKAGQRMRDGNRVYRLLAVTEADAGMKYLTCFARQEEVSA